MSLRPLIKNAGKFLGFKIGRTVAAAGNALAVYDIERHDYSLKGDRIYFKKLNLTLSRLKASPLLEGYENAVRLATRKDVVFSENASGDLEVKIDNASFRINDEEELFILCEIFLEGAYNLLSPTKQKMAVIDIGMNVGITSIFYASRNNVEKVFSYEPFTPTFNMALQNIALNPDFSAKIKPNNFGLAKEGSHIQAAFSMRQKGRMGLNGIPSQSTVIDKVGMETIVLKPVREHFAAIKEEVKHNFVVCKMDCEGAEFELIDSLDEEGLLGLPDVYFIEWHYKSPDMIVSRLINNNFNVINSTFSELTSGMIYAIKTK